ncbi:MAG: hypothetical protein IJS28_04045 [Synergistaceae bacterium]|nr:hypothetical protein [Synergistaceae bacterium]
MNVFYPDDYPKTREEAIQALRSVREEDIDYSDIPPLSDNVIVNPIGWKFAEVRKRNRERMNAARQAGSYERGLSR